MLQCDLNHILGRAALWRTVTDAYGLLRTQRAQVRHAGGVCARRTSVAQWRAEPGEAAEGAGLNAQGHWHREDRRSGMERLTHGVSSPPTPPAPDICFLVCPGQAGADCY